MTDALSFLERAAKAKVQPLYVLAGDEDFLKRQVVTALRGLVLGPNDQDFNLSTHPGDKATWSAVCGELETMPFLSPYRLLVVEKADPFVTRYRPALEKYATEPAPRGVLVLDVKSWPATTRLAKLVPPGGTITCKAPAAYRLPDWCVKWAAARHGKELDPRAARLLVDLVGAEMGLLDQELAKLVVGARGSRIEAGDVDRLVGSSRGENVFRILDALAADRPGEALAILDRLLAQGEDPHRILGAFSMQLRRLAQAARLTRRGYPLLAALDEVEIPVFARQSSEQQLRHLGPRRLDKLFDWLLELDLGLKGGSELPPRTLLERMIGRLAGTDSTSQGVPAGQAASRNQR